MHFGDIDLEIRGMAHTRRPSRNRHGIAVDDYLDKARLRRQSGDGIVASVRSRQAALVPVLAMAARGWRALRDALRPRFRRALPTSEMLLHRRPK